MERNAFFHNSSGSAVYSYFWESEFNVAYRERRLKAKINWIMYNHYLQRLWVNFHFWSLYFLMLFAGFFQLNHSFEVRVGVLYALYLLYETQPSANTSSHKYKINVSLGNWTSIFDLKILLMFVLIALWNDFQKLYEEIKQRKVVDAYAIFRKMQR